MRVSPLPSRTPLRVRVRSAGLDSWTSPMAAGPPPALTADQARPPTDADMGPNTGRSLGPGPVVLLPQPPSSGVSASARTGIVTARLIVVLRDDGPEAGGVAAPGRARAPRHRPFSTRAARAAIPACG